MSYLITPTPEYFNLDYDVPALEDAGKSVSDLELVIDTRIPVLLRNKVLGSVLFASLNSDIEPTTGQLKNTAAQKWKDLVDGKSYTDAAGIAKVWDGLLPTFGTSVLVPYAFYYWFRQQIKVNSGIGQVNVEGKNSVKVNPTETMVTTWNAFLEQYQSGCGFLEYGQPFVYNVGVPYPYAITPLNGLTNSSVTLLEFLSDNPTNYPDAALARFGEVENQLGL